MTSDQGPDYFPTHAHIADDGIHANIVGKARLQTVPRAAIAENVMTERIGSNRGLALSAALVIGAWLVRPLASVLRNIGRWTVFGRPAHL